MLSDNPYILDALSSEELLHELMNYEYSIDERVFGVGIAVDITLVKRHIDNLNAIESVRKDVKRNTEQLKDCLNAVEALTHEIQRIREEINDLNK